MCLRALAWVRGRVYVRACIVVPIMQSASVAFLAAPHFSTFINGTIFEKKITEHKMCVFIFSVTFMWNISQDKNNSAKYHKCRNVCHINYSLFLSDINGTSVFSTEFREKLKNQIASKSGQWGASCCMRTDRHYEANIAFAFCQRAWKSGCCRPWFCACR